MANLRLKTSTSRRLITCLPAGEGERQRERQKSTRMSKTEAAQAVREEQLLKQWRKAKPALEKADVRKSEK